MEDRQDDVQVRALPAPKPVRKHPRERFTKIAPKRTQKVLDALRLLGRCGNSATYQYEREEVDKIFKAIEDELSRAKSRFDDNEPTTFTL